MIAINKKNFFRIIFLLIALGSAALWWIVNSTDKRMRAELLQQARLAAKGSCFNLVSQLSGSEKDLDSEAYRSIKSQLALIREAKPNCRFLYLLGRHVDGEIFFFADSLPPDSEDYAPPGLIYDEAPESYILTFETKKEAVVGPVTDRWGTLITALIPIVSQDTGTLLAVMGMDVEARNWTREIISHCIGPSLVILLLTLLIFIIASREEILVRLYNSEERFRTLANAAFEGIVISDDEKILDANASVAKLSGYSIDELIGQNIIDFIRPEDRDNVKIKILSNYEKPYEIMAITKDGVEMPLEVCSKIYSFNGKKVRVTALRDLTEKKEAENEIRTLQGIIPICSYCKEIRDDKGYWNKIEGYISAHSAAEFSHSICPKCANKYFSDMNLFDD